jgi:hypothetical protein
VSEFSIETVEDTNAEALAAQRADGEAIQKRGTRQLLMARGVFMVFSYAASVILARVLGPADFGIYGVLLATLVWLEIVSYAGVPAATGRLIPAHQHESAEVERSARFVLFVSGLSLFAIAWVAAPAVARIFHLSGGARLFRLAILDIPAATMFQCYAGTLMGLRRFGPISLGQAVMGIAKLAGVLALFVVGISVEHALLANVFATAARISPVAPLRAPHRFARRRHGGVRHLVAGGHQSRRLVPRQSVARDESRGGTVLRGAQDRADPRGDCHGAVGRAAGVGGLGIGRGRPRGGAPTRRGGQPLRAHSQRCGVRRRRG